MRCTKADQLGTFLETSQTRSVSQIPETSQPTTAQLIQPGMWRITTASRMKLPSHAQLSPTFDHYVESLQPWEAELLRHVDLPTDPYTATFKLIHGGGIRVVSDGSVWHENQGAYGWALSTASGERIASGMGPASGSTIDSYRAEAYGMLATLCFLRRLAEYTNHADAWWNGILATDSQSLLEAITVSSLPC